VFDVALVQGSNLPKNERRFNGENLEANKALRLLARSLSMKGNGTSTTVQGLKIVVTAVSPLGSQGGFHGFGPKSLGARTLSENDIARSVDFKANLIAGFNIQLPANFGRNGGLPFCCDNRGFQEILQGNTVLQ
jgi:hypothetical protein